jgi:hypothetical protein
MILQKDNDKGEVQLIDPGECSTADAGHSM